MCGITGFWGPIGHKDESEQELRRMMRVLAHRGPDGDGVWYDPEVGIGLAHRRLAVVDLSSAGQQPMHSRCGRWVVSYNGEIYSAEALRHALAARHGATFNGHSDTEALVEALAAWGLESTLPRLNGMFAFAAFDRQQKKLHLVRDRLGIKPLYYGRLGSRWVFASELGAIRVAAPTAPAIDRAALANYFRFGTVHGSRSIFKGVYRLQPGTRVELTADKSASTDRYWSVPVAAPLAQPTESNYADSLGQLRYRLRAAVESRLITDVPLGAFLSGGIDSSLLVALMQSMTTQPVKTFTIGFSSSSYDESTSAKAVAKFLKTDHTELIVSPLEAQTAISELAGIWDEPFADSSQIPTYLVSQLARKSVTVAISGDGADELFGGYNRHIWAPRVQKRAGFLPHAARSALASLLQSLSPSNWDHLYASIERAIPNRLRMRLAGDKIHKLARLLRARTSDAAYLALCSQWDCPLKIVRGATEEAQPWASTSDVINGVFAEQMMRLDLLNYLPDDILTKVDRASMAVGLEVRVPYLDHQLVEFATQLPLAHRIRNGVGKALLRDLLSEHLPRSLFERPKMGFGVPLGDWLRKPLLRSWGEELLCSARLRREGWIDPIPVRTLWKAHQSGRVNAEHRLWPVLAFQSWLENRK